MEWSQNNIHELVIKQRNYFNSGVTLPLSFRLDALKKLKSAILNNQKDIEKALYNDIQFSVQVCFHSQIITAPFCT